MAQKSKIRGFLFGNLWFRLIIGWALAVTCAISPNIVSGVIFKDGIFYWSEILHPASLIFFSASFAWVVFEIERFRYENDMQWTFRKQVRTVVTNEAIKHFKKQLVQGDVSGCVQNMEKLDGFFNQ
jgi:hypothetical protein